MCIGYNKVCKSLTHLTMNKIGLPLSLSVQTCIMFRWSGKLNVTSIDKCRVDFNYGSAIVRELNTTPKLKFSPFFL